MKKVFAMWAIAALLLAACGKDETTKLDPEGPQNEEPAQPEEPENQEDPEDSEVTETTVSFDFAAQEYANKADVTAIRQDGIEIAFSNAKWFDNGESLRVYSSSTITLSSAKEITKVVFSFADAAGMTEETNPITVDKGSWETDTWTGAAGKVLFTVGGASGHRRITKMDVTHSGKDAEKEDNPGGKEEVTAGTDVITVGFTGVRSGGSYYDWSGKKGPVSSAVYAGYTANYQDKAIQLNAKKEAEGIISTVSAGKVTKVSIVWNSNTYEGSRRALQVYGSDMAYTATTDLYQNGTCGTLIGSLVYPEEMELTIDGNYAYIGLRSEDGAFYLDEIRITWE